MNSLVGLYRPGASILHRLPAGLKLVALLVAGACSVLVRTPAQAATAMACVLLGYAIGGVPVRVVLETLRPLLWVLVPLGLFQVLVVGWERATVIVGGITTLVMLANLVTLTTRTSELVHVVVRLSRGFRLLGVSSERVGLMLSLAIRAVPLITELATRAREAQHARGRPASPRAFAVPLIIGALRRADELGDALAARGYDD